MLLYLTEEELLNKAGLRTCKAVQKWWKQVISDDWLIDSCINIYLPGQRRVSETGSCPGECTKQLLEQEAYVTTVFNHMHYLGEWIDLLSVVLGQIYQFSLVDKLSQKCPKL